MRRWAPALVVSGIVALLVVQANAGSSFGTASGLFVGLADDLYVNDDAFDGVTIDSSATSTVSQCLHVTSTSTGTPAAGIGAGMSFIVETAAGNDETGVLLDAVTTDVTATSEDFDLVVSTMQGGSAAAEVFRMGATSTATGAFAVTGTTDLQGNPVDHPRE